jgi:phage FluMu gp28-like protein
LSPSRLAGETAGDLRTGFDAGRTRNASELIVLERASNRLVFRLRKTLMGEKFQAQEAILRDLLASTPRLQRLCIDRTGLSMNLAENLRGAFHGRVEPLALLGPTKESLALGLIIAMDNQQVAIPRDRDLVAQIHSVGKSPKEGGYSRFDTDRNEKHHGDAFRALAMAVHAAGDIKRNAKVRKWIQASIV